MPQVLPGAAALGFVSPSGDGALAAGCRGRRTAGFCSLLMRASKDNPSERALWFRNGLGLLVILTGASRGHLETWLFSHLSSDRLGPLSSCCVRLMVPSLLVQAYGEGRTSGFTVCFGLGLVNIQNISNKICISEKFLSQKKVLNQKARKLPLLSEGSIWV